MGNATLAEIKRALLGALPMDGAPIGSIRLRRELAETHGKDVPEKLYEQARDQLVDENSIARDRGRGGSVRCLTLQAAEPLVLAAQEIPAGNARPVPTQTMMSLAGKVTGQPTRPKAKSTPEEKVLSCRHGQHRINNPGSFRPPGWPPL